MFVEKDYLYIWQGTLTMPKNFAPFAFSFGVVNSTMGFTLAGSGFKSLAVSRLAKNVNSVTVIWHFPLLRVTLLHLQKSSTFFTFCKCNFVSVLQIPMSFIEVFTFFIPSNILRIVLWYISCVDDIPNGNLRYLYFPSGVMKVHNQKLYFFI